MTKEHYLPALIAHADWGTDDRKRWMACATLGPDARYVAYAPERVGWLGDFLQRLRTRAQPGGVFIGFDFPIGLPIAYANKVGVDRFLDLLPRLGSDDWGDFFRPAERPEQVSLRRPFYPQRPGGTCQAHLLEGLGIDSAQLLRRCERGYEGRAAASLLFWTLGGKQVGKAAICGWRDVLAPALRSDPDCVRIWPFSGRLEDLLSPQRVVVAETYPAEVYGHLGVNFPRSQNGGKWGKRVRSDRCRNASALMDWARTANVRLDEPLVEAIRDGFGNDSGGEDRFDAFIGLCGMLDVVLGRRSPGDPADRAAKDVEGWILGQTQPG